MDSLVVLNFYWVCAIDPQVHFQSVVWDAIFASILYVKLKRLLKSVEFTAQYLYLGTDSDYAGSFMSWELRMIPAEKLDQLDDAINRRHGDRMMLSQQSRLVQYRLTSLTQALEEAHVGSARRRHMITRKNKKPSCPSLARRWPPWFSLKHASWERWGVKLRGVLSSFVYLCE